MDAYYRGLKWIGPCFLGGGRVPLVGNAVKNLKRLANSMPLPEKHSFGER